MVFQQWNISTVIVFVQKEHHIDFLPIACVDELADSRDKRVIRQMVKINDLLGPAHSSALLGCPINTIHEAKQTKANRQNLRV